VIGVATGLVTAVTGVYVIPAVPYMQALGLEKDELVQAAVFRSPSRRLHSQPYSRTTGRSRAHRCWRWFRL